MPAKSDYQDGSQSKRIEEIVEFLARHYSSLVLEDLLFQNIRSLIKRLAKESYKKYSSECMMTGNSYDCMKEIENYLRKLPNMIYATSNEPVRLGAFRVMFLELHNRFLGDLVFKPSRAIDLALHGILREELVISTTGSRVPLESFHIGIDYVFLVEYPAPNRESKVVVPLFIVAKSSPRAIKEIRVKEAVGALLEESLERSVRLDNVMEALRNIPRFIRVVLTRTALYGRENSKSCIIRGYSDMLVYNDIMCGIIGLILKDIPGIYKTIVEDEKLAGITTEDWIKALIGVSLPLQVVAASGGRPPDPPGGINADYLAKRVRQETLEKVGKEIHQQMLSIKNYASQVKQSIERKLSSIIDYYREYKGAGTAVEMRVQ